MSAESVTVTTTKHLFVVAEKAEDVQPLVISHLAGTLPEWDREKVFQDERDAGSRAFQLNRYLETDTHHRVFTVTVELKIEGS
jgi:hypothetical protein